MVDDPLRLADRMGRIEASGIRKFFDLAQQMENPINLSIGMAHFDPPQEVQDAAIKAIRDGQNRYSVTQGIEPLRGVLREQLSRNFPISDEDDLMITCGVSGGLMLSYLCTLNPGDELMVPDPYFVMYKHLAVVAGATPKTYITYPNFEITREALDAAYSDKTRAILLNSPSNPTGYVASEAEVKLVAEFAQERNLLLISDEIYDFFMYDRPHVSPKRFNRNTIVLGGFSKSMGIPGWRMGYAVGPSQILAQMRVLSQFSFVCAPPPAQWGVLEGLKHDYCERREEYHAKRDFVYEGLKERFDVVKPEGAFYIFPGLRNAKSGEFVERCIEHNLLIVPGSACSDRDSHIRVSYAADNETLKRGIDVLNKVADSFN